jgi:hypothetical protein
MKLTLGMHFGQPSRIGFLLLSFFLVSFMPVKTQNQIVIGAEVVFEISIMFNKMMWLVAPEDSVNFSCCESFRSDIVLNKIKLHFCLRATIVRITEVSIHAFQITA